jgi:hypothetical protein
VTRSIPISQQLVIHFGDGHLETRHLLHREEFAAGSGRQRYSPGVEEFFSTAQDDVHLHQRRRPAAIDHEDYFVAGPGFDRGEQA